MVSTIRGKRFVRSLTAIEPYLGAILAGDDAKAIMLDFMHPQATGGQRIGFGGKARGDEAGWESTHTQHAGS
jgi:hypothetical protein